MGTAITSLLVKNYIDIKDLKNKTLVVDGQNMLYQFLTTIRQQDGSLLTDTQGNVTSHLIGLISRITTFMQNSIRLIFVFDGRPPDLKVKELERRKLAKLEAKELYEKAKLENDIISMKKFASRTTRLSKEMINEAEFLLDALGIPVIHAPAEGEAQAARIVKNDDAFAVISQDADALLFGAPRIIRNLSVSGRRKIGLTYKKIEPELISLRKTLLNLDINLDKLIALSMLVGTDFNIKGIKGIGPKKALALVKKFDDFNELFKSVNWDSEFNVDWRFVFNTIKNMPVVDDYVIEFNQIDEQKVIELLVKKHDFSLERVKSFLNKLNVANKNNKQRSIFDFK